MRAFRAAALTVAVFFAGVVAWRLTSVGRLASDSQPSGSPPAFVGTATCAGCHQEQQRAWTGSQHDRAMQPADPDTVRGDFNDARVTAGRVTSRFFTRGGRFFVNTDAADGTLQDFEVAYTFGVEPLQQYLVRLAGGRMQPLPIAWDTRPRTAGGQRWFHLYGDAGIPHGDDLHWTGRLQNWNFMCADCHSTGVRKGYDAATRQFKTTWSEVNVGCEACHGPGARHVAWAKAPRVLRRLWRDNGLEAQLTERRGAGWMSVDGRPRRSAPLTTRREVDVCAQCHARRAQLQDGYTAGAPLHDFYEPDPMTPGLYYSDGQQRDEVYVVGSFLQSRMHAAGVTCSDCHDPHTERVRAVGNALCVRCHTASTYDATEHHRHQVESPAAQCVSCHMPATTYMLVDPRRDHSFRVPRPDRTATMGMPNVCTGCHTDRTPQWAAAALRVPLDRALGFQRFAEAFHAAETSAPDSAQALRDIVIDQTQPAIVRASALARLRDDESVVAVDAAHMGLTDPDPMVRWSALAVLERLTPRDRAQLAAASLEDPARSVRIQAAWLLAPAMPLLMGEASRAFERAANEFEASQRYNADRIENRVALGSFYAQTGRVSEAEREYRDALTMSTTSAVAYVNLADLFRAQGREAETRQTLRSGLDAIPGNAALEHALGLALIRAGDAAEAVQHLASAATGAPDQAEFAYTYAVALNGAGRTDEAIRVLEIALMRRPRNRDVLFALATFHRDAGRTTDALRFARLLDTLGDPRGRTLVGAIAPTVPPSER